MIDKALMSPKPQQVKFYEIKCSKNIPVLWLDAALLVAKDFEGAIEVTRKVYSF